MSLASLLDDYIEIDYHIDTIVNIKVVIA